MSDLSDRIANLSPEKRQMLMRRLGRVSSVGPEEWAGQESGDRPPQSGAQPHSNCRLEIIRPGTLESLSMRETERIVPEQSQVEIEVKAASLNFRDLLIALGAYPSDSGRAPVMGS